MCRTIRSYAIIVQKKEDRIMNETKPSSAPTVCSVIALVASVLAFINALILVLISVFGPESGSATALTNRAVFFVSGMVLFTAGTWIFGILGGFAGFVMLIVDLAIKRGAILWMPIVSMILSTISIIMSVLVY